MEGQRKTHPRLEIRRLSEADFAGLSGAWDELLSQSDADPLFMSWPWLYSWWEVWNRCLELELALFGVFDEADTLVGLAPFFLHQFRSPLGMTVRRLHFLGNAWRILPTVRTEYCGLIIRRGLEEPIAELLLAEVARLTWHEVVVCDQSMQELLQWQEAFDRQGQNVLTVPRSIDAGVRVPVNGAFSDWLHELGPNTRLKAYNRRKYLAKRGELSYRRVASAEAKEFLRTLNEFHHKRWGKPCFDDRAVDFHQRLLERLPEERVALSALNFNDKTVSVLYDVKAGSTRYNLQAGFDEFFDPKVALGTLHLGYAIEESFSDPDIACYDLLAGRGKKSFYKSRFQGEKVHFVTVQFARHPVMRCIYRVQSWLPGVLRQQINRYVRL